MTFSIGSIGLLIFLIIAVLFYVVGFPLVARVSPQVFGKEQSEGEFRFAHCRIREYAESIAFYGGEPEEVKNIDKTFASVLTKQALVARTTFPLTSKTLYYDSPTLAFTTFMSNAHYNFGFLILGFQVFLKILPGKFSNFKTPGDQTNALIQMNAGIKTFMMGLTTLLSSPELITAVVGTVNRVGEMMESLEEKQKNVQLQGGMSKGAVIVSPDTKGIEFQNVTLAVPTKEKLLAEGKVL